MSKMKRMRKIVSLVLSLVMMLTMVAGMTTVASAADVSSEIYSYNAATKTHTWTFSKLSADVTGATISPDTECNLGGNFVMSFSANNANDKIMKAGYMGWAGCYTGNGSTRYAYFTPEKAGTLTIKRWGNEANFVVSEELTTEPSTEDITTGTTITKELKANTKYYIYFVLTNGSTVVGNIHTLNYVEAEEVAVETEAPTEAPAHDVSGTVYSYDASTRKHTWTMSNLSANYTGQAGGAIEVEMGGNMVVSLNGVNDFLDSRGYIHWNGPFNNNGRFAYITPEKDGTLYVSNYGTGDNFVVATTTSATAPADAIAIGKNVQAKLEAGNKYYFYFVGSTANIYSVYYIEDEEVVVTPEPTATPTPEPTATPEPVVEPTVEGTVTTWDFVNENGWKANVNYDGLTIKTSSIDYSTNLGALIYCAAGAYAEFTPTENGTINIKYNRMTSANAVYISDTAAFDYDNYIVKSKSDNGWIKNLVDTSDGKSSADKLNLVAGKTYYIYGKNTGSESRLLFDTITYDTALKDTAYRTKDGTMTSDIEGELGAPYWTFTNTFENASIAKISLRDASVDEVRVKEVDFGTVFNGEVKFSIVVKDAPENIEAKLGE